MNIEDITTIEELADFMTAEAALWGRSGSDQKFVHGAGMREQWHERINFPYAVFYMLGREATEDEITDNPFTTQSGRHVIFNMEAMYFDEDGNRTERPKRNQDVLYHND